LRLEILPVGPFICILSFLLEALTGVSRVIMRCSLLMDVRYDMADIVLFWEDE